MVNSGSSPREDDHAQVDDSEIARERLMESHEGAQQMANAEVVELQKMDSHFVA